MRELEASLVQFGESGAKPNRSGLESRIDRQTESWQDVIAGHRVAFGMMMHGPIGTMGGDRTMVGIDHEHQTNVYRQILRDLLPHVDMPVLR